MVRNESRSSAHGTDSGPEAAMLGTASLPRILISERMSQLKDERFEARPSDSLPIAVLVDELNLRLRQLFENFLEPVRDCADSEVVRIKYGAGTGRPDRLEHITVRAFSETVTMALTSWERSIRAVLEDIRSEWPGEIRAARVRQNSERIDGPLVDFLDTHFQNYPWEPRLSGPGEFEVKDNGFGRAGSVPCDRSLDFEIIRRRHTEEMEAIYSAENALYEKDFLKALGVRSTDLPVEEIFDNLRKRAIFSQVISMDECFNYCPEAVASVARAVGLSEVPSIEAKSEIVTRAERLASYLQNRYEKEVEPVELYANEREMLGLALSAPIGTWKLQSTNPVTHHENSISYGLECEVQGDKTLHLKISNDHLFCPQLATASLSMEKGRDYSTSVTYEPADPFAARVLLAMLDCKSRLGGGALEALRSRSITGAV